MTVNPIEAAGNTIQSARWNVILAKLQGAQSGGSADRDVIMTGIYARDAIKSANLTHYWKFDEEDTAKALDYTAGNEYDLTGTSITAFADGILKSAVDLDGTADYFSTTTLTDLADDTTGTISVWSYLDDTNDTVNSVLSVFNDANAVVTGFEIRYDLGDGYLDAYVYADGVAQWTIRRFQSAQYVGQWVNIVVTHDGVSPKMFVNGEPIGEIIISTDKTMWMKAIITDAADPADNLTIGGRNYNSSFGLPFDGKIDEVMIWNTALTPEEVRRLYASYSPEKIAGLDATPSQGVAQGEDLKLYYDFDGDRNTNPVTVLDKSGWGNNGTTGGTMLAADWVDGKYGSALDFEGTDDTIAIKDSNANLGFLANDTKGTVAIWVKVDTDDEGLNDLMSISRNADTTETRFNIRYDFGAGDDHITIRIRVDGTTQFTVNTADDFLDDYIGVWCHVVVVQDGVEPKLYVNGVEVNLTFVVDTDKTVWFKDILTDATSVADTLSIGGLWNNGSLGQPFDGKVDEVRYYGHDLSAEEVWSLYNSSKPSLPSVQTDLTSGLTGYWSFDEYVVTSYTSAYDYSTASTPLTLTHVSAPPVGQGKYGLAPHYDGTADYTSATITAATTEWFSDTTGTISWWMYLDADPAGTDQAVLTISDASTNNATQIMVYLEDSTEWLNIFCRLDNANIWGIDAPAGTNFANFVGKWVHVALVQDGVSAKVYINGINVTHNNFGIPNEWINDLTTATAPADTLTIGAWANNNSFEDFFDGTIDDVRIYSRPLTAREVWQLYQGRRY